MTKKYHIIFLTLVLIGVELLTFKEGYASDSISSLTIGGQLRYRFESKQDFTLNKSSNEDDNVSLFRERFNLDYHPQKWARIFIEGQDARSIASSGLNKTDSYIDSIDLRQAYFEAKNFSGIPLQVKIGRQELSYGEDRLVGTSDWSNTSKGFDAAKLVYQVNPDLKLDFFYSQTVLVRSYKFDSDDSHDHFYGLYSAWNFNSKNVLDTFLFIRDNQKKITGELPGEVGVLREFTGGNRLKGQWLDWDYGTEYAIQWGKRTQDDISAWMFHQELGYTFSGAHWTPRLAVEYDHASGDKNSHDGKAGTFDQLFAVNHNKYGYIDFLGLKNMDDIRASFGVKPDKKLSLSADYHYFLLDTPSASWFNAAGTAIRSANPSAARSLAQEIDLLAMYKLSDQWSFSGGYSRFFSGAFIKDTGAHNDADFFYGQAAYKF